MPAVPPGRPANRRDDERPEPGPILGRGSWATGSPAPLKRPRAARHGRRPRERIPFRAPDPRQVEAARPAPEAPRPALLLNELSNPDFGWPLRDAFSGWELGGQAVEVVGGFPCSAGFAADGVGPLQRRELRAALLRSRSAEPVHFGLLKVRAGDRRRGRPPL